VGEATVGERTAEQGRYTSMAGPWNMTNDHHPR